MIAQMKMNFSKSINRLILKLIFQLVILFLMGVVPAFADNPSKIFIVNSDATVTKYREVKLAFISQLNKQTNSTVEFTIDDNHTPEQLEKLIKSENPDLIFSIGSQAYQLSSQYGENNPILFSSAINWQRFGHRDNTFGIANELSMSQELSLSRYVLPGLNRIGVIYDPKFNTERIAEARKQATELGLTLVELNNFEADSLEKNVEELLSKIDILWLIADPSVLSDKDTVEKIFNLSTEHKKPIITYSNAFMSYGASLIIAADTPTMGRQAANLAQNILLHERIKEVVQTPAGSHIALNVCQLNKINIRYNADALDAVNQIIECK